MGKVNPWKITGYKAGQNVVCKVSHAEPGGYAVIIPKDNLPGFLPTEQPLKAGEEVLAQFVCVSNSRILLQCRFGTNNTKNGAKVATVNWEEQLNTIDGKSGEKIDYHRPTTSPGLQVSATAATPPQTFIQDQSYAQEFDQEPQQDAFGQAQYGQERYSQDQYAQGQYGQDQYAQGQYQQEQYSEGSYAQDYSGAQYEQANQQQTGGYDFTQPSQFAQHNQQQDQFGTQSGRFQPLTSAPQGMPQQNQPPGGYQQQQSYQGISGTTPDYSQQNMQFNPQQGNADQSGPPGSTFTAPQGGMQFKPQLPADYAETQNQWSSQANLPQASPPGMGQTPVQNPYQAPVQTAGQYQSGSMPQSYQQPPQNAPATAFQAPPTNGGGGFQGGQSGQYQAPPPAPAQYTSGSHAQTAYQSPASYQGPAQTPVPAPAPPVVVEQTPPPAPPVAAPVKETPAADDWGYSGQGWDDGVRLTKAPAAEALTAPAGPASEADAAFRVWAPKAQTREFHVKRATDLVPPAFDLDSLATFTAEEQDLEWLITDIEGGMRTGCVKAVSQSSMSRSAALLYKGRAVGCIYGRKQQPENYGTEQSLQIMMQDLEKPDTNVELYDLPDSVVLSMSALFLGYPVPKEENVDARTYMDYMCNWFASKSQTACLAIAFPSRSATCLCFIHDGVFCGAFYVEEQKFTTEKEFVYGLMQNDPQASVEASILPPEMTSSAVRFGFNLSMARKKGY